MLGYGLVGLHLPPLVVEVCCNLIAGSIRMGENEDHKINHVRTDNLHTCTIAGTTILNNAVGPPI